MSGRPIRWARLEAMEPGQEVTVRERISAELVAATARLTGDQNPIHVDAQAALEMGQSRPMAHGVILLGMVSRLIGMELPGPGSIWFENEVEFLAPVYPGDEVELTAQVMRVSPATSVVILELRGRKLPDVPVLRGQAKVRVSTLAAERNESVGGQESVVLVTGASRGLGRSIAEVLASRGMRVVVNFRTDETGAKDVVRAIESAGGRAIAAGADVSESIGARRLFEQAMEMFGRVDVIVHNATPPIRHKQYLDTTPEDFRGYFDTYVVGLHELARLAVPGMQERKYGRIIAILSSYIAEVPTKLAAYITGKQALYGFCRALAVELGPWNITVNMVSPSVLIGPRTDELGIAAREIISRKIPLRRLGHPDDVGRTVAFLAGEESSFISGVNIPVAGGILF